MSPESVAKLSIEWHEKSGTDVAVCVEHFARTYLLTAEAVCVVWKLIDALSGKSSR
jgi:hypothetical protein